jgi:ABC-type Zn uptake system ZnuABC Zn-binding protein ZnuA
VPAIFADTSAPADLARTLAEDVGGIDVVELFSESLGGPDSEGRSYIEMVRTNAERIADALS